MKNKIKVAIFDLTDCEGCELQFFAFWEKLLDLAKSIEITNWRLAKAKNDNGPFDVAFIEGSPLTQDDIEMIKEIRQSSGAVVALGDCASLAGIPGIVSSGEREALARKIYGKNYELAVKKVYPLSHYINIDYHIRGCPVTQKELEYVVSGLIWGKVLSPKAYPVCLECKAKENHCLLLEDKPCLGPITKGGCDALCPSVSHRCYGCFGPAKGANIESFKKHLVEVVGRDEANRQMHFFITNPSMEEENKDPSP